MESPGFGRGSLGSIPGSGRGPLRVRAKKEAYAKRRTQGSVPQIRPTWPSDRRKPAKARCVSSTCHCGDTCIQKQNSTTSL